VNREAAQIAERLQGAGVAPGEVSRRARNLLAAPWLNHAGLGYLLKTWERWGGCDVEAAERWTFYVRNGLTDPIWPTHLPELVSNGAWPSMEAATSELKRVRPWEIDRVTAGDRRKAIAKLSERLPASRAP
jgi:hypothetical protein